MSLCIYPRFRVRVGLLVAAAMVSWPFSAGADTEHLVVVIVPSFRPASPTPPAFICPTTAAMGAASSDGPYARAAVSDGSLLRWH